MAKPPRTTFAIQALTSNFGAACSPTVSKETNRCKPTKDTYKLNVDAAYMGDGSGGVGAVVRNCNGEAITFTKLA